MKKKALAIFLTLIIFAFMLLATSCVDPDKPGPNGTPSAPRTVVAAKFNTEDGYFIAFTWAAPLNNGGSEITGYQLSAGDGVWFEFNADDLIWPDSVFRPAAENAYLFIGLDRDSTYTLRVRAVNANGEGRIAEVKI